MGNFEDRVDDIEFWRDEIFKLEKKLKTKGLSKEKRIEIETEIGELETAIDCVQEEGGIPDFY